MLRATMKCATWRRTRSAVERLWEVCQVPDYRKIAPAAHAELALTLYGFLMREGKSRPTGSRSQVAQADRTDGDIDTLVEPDRAHPDLDLRGKPAGLARRSRALARRRRAASRTSCRTRCTSGSTERFVDRRTSVLMRRLRENTMLETEISKTGEVVVEGHLIGRLDGFTFAADASRRRAPKPRRLRAAAQKALAGEIDARAARLAMRPTSNSCWPPTAHCAGSASRSASSWRATTCCARACASSPTSSSPAPRATSCRRGSISGSRRTSRGCSAPLFALAAAEDVTGIARGVAFQLDRGARRAGARSVAEEVKGLDQQSRATLRKYGVRFGAYHLYLPVLLKPGAARACGAALGAEGRRPGDQGPRRSAASGRLRPHLVPGRQGRRRRRSTASSAIACAASARCASIFWSGSPI